LEELDLLVISVTELRKKIEMIPKLQVDLETQKYKHAELEQEYDKHLMALRDQMEQVLTAPNPD